MHCNAALRSKAAFANGVQTESQSNLQASIPIGSCLRKYLRSPHVVSSAKAGQPFCSWYPWIKTAGTLGRGAAYSLGHASRASGSCWLELSGGHNCALFDPTYTEK